MIIEVERMVFVIVSEVVLFGMAVIVKLFIVFRSY